MKNLFEKPYIDVVKFSVFDVLTTSPTEDDVYFEEENSSTTTDSTPLFGQ